MFIDSHQHDCILCAETSWIGRGRDVLFIGNGRQILCKRCRDRLIASNVEDFEKTVEVLTIKMQSGIDQAIQNVNFAVQDVPIKRKALSDAIKRSENFWPRILFSFISQKNVKKHEQQLHDAEAKAVLAEEALLQALLQAGEEKSQVLMWLKNLEKPRIRFALKRQSTIEESRAHQDSRLVEYLGAITSLGFDRNLLVIRNADYKRGNLIENHIRAKWIERISVACGGKCFICGSLENHTLDHLWLPKNEGGNFVVCVRSAKALASNVLLLCRSCNASKGERKTHQFIPLQRIPEIEVIQKDLSEQMNRDKELKKIAQKWYGVAISIPPE